MVVSSIFSKEFLEAEDYSPRVSSCSSASRVALRGPGDLGPGDACGRSLLLRRAGDPPHVYTIVRTHARMHACTHARMRVCMYACVQYACVRRARRAGQVSSIDATRSRSRRRALFASRFSTPALGARVPGPAKQRVRVLLHRTLGQRASAHSPKTATLRISRADFAPGGSKRFGATQVGALDGA